MTSRLKVKATTGIKWTSIKTIFNSILQPIYRILLALLLLPTEFAYIAVITLIVSFAEMLNNIGIGEAVIQRENVTRKDLSSLFIFNLIITFVIAVLTYLSSGIIENYYSMKDLELIIKLISLIILINGSTSLFKFYLHKEFYFKETSIIQILKTIIEICISIILILLGYGIWGFVIAILLSNFIHGILLSVSVFKKTNFRISMNFSLKNVSRFLNFGIFVSGKKILTFFSHRIDEIIIGGVLTPEILGTYFFAKNILIQLQTLITTSFGQVLLPVFSKIKGDIIKLKKYYIKIFSLVIFIGFPIFVGVSLTASYFVPVFFGEDWNTSVSFFQILSIPTLVILLNAGISTSLMYAMDKSSLVFKIDLVFVSSYIMILLLFNTGKIMNVIIIYILYVIFKFAAIQYFLSRMLKINFFDYYRVFKGTVISTLFMSISVLVVKFFLGDVFADLPILVLSILVGIIIYIFSSFIFCRSQINEVLLLFKSMTKKI